MSSAATAAKSAASTVRITLGLIGLLALIAGILVLAWPGKVAEVVVDRFTPEVRRTFRGLLGQALAAAPQPELADALAEMTPERRGRITRLIDQYAPAERSRR